MKALLPIVVLVSLLAVTGSAQTKKPRPKTTPAPTKAAAPRMDAPAEPKTELAPTDIPGNDATSAEAQRLSRSAMAAFSKGDLRAAQRDFEKALALAPNNAAILINLGLIAYRQRDYADAEKRLREIVRREPDTGLAWLLLGIVYYDQVKLDAALAALAQAVLLEPKDARAHHYLGVTIGRKGWYSGAEDEMRKAIELQPEYAEAHFNLAVFYLQRSPPSVELARRHYQKALDLGSPPDPQVETKLNH